MKPDELRRRTSKSFLIFILIWITGVGLWTWARNQPEIDERPAPFRKVLEWNGKLWRALYNPARENHASPPAPGKRPRVNGDIGLKIPVDLNRWRLEVVPDDKDPKRPKFDLTMAELKALPRSETATQFVCIEGWSENFSYAGIRFSDFLKHYRLGTHSGGPWDPKHPPEDTYRYVGLETPDGVYYVSIDMESMLHPQTLLVYEMNGRPLEPANGAPLRLLIPVKYGIKSLKRVGRIFFSDQRPPDYWAERGYDWFAGL